MELRRGMDGKSEDVRGKGELDRYGFQVGKKDLRESNIGGKKRTNNIAAVLPGLLVPPRPLLGTLIKVVSKTIRQERNQEQTQCSCGQSPF